ncbi:hypothetical protein GSY69_12225, partial [Brevibacterium sp. 5221]|nr:hypothetical protein [Brevibacterium rongguiense]
PGIGDLAGAAEAASGAEQAATGGIAVPAQGAQSRAGAAGGPSTGGTRQVPGTPG